MNPNKLSKRLKFIKASKLNDRASVKVRSRRGLNKSVNLEDAHPNDDFDDFFKFEDDLADLKPSSQQFLEMEKNIEKSYSNDNNKASDPYVIMEPKDKFTHSLKDNKNEKKDNAEKATLPLDNFKYEESKRCISIIKNGNRCKFNTVEGSIYCGIHKKKNNIDAKNNIDTKNNLDLEK